MAEAVSQESSREADLEVLAARFDPEVDRELLQLALTHRSYAHEAGESRRTSAWSSWAIPFSG